MKIEEDIDICYLNFDESTTDSTVLIDVNELLHDIMLLLWFNVPNNPWIAIELFIVNKNIKYKRGNNSIHIHSYDFMHCCC